MDDFEKRWQRIRDQLGIEMNGDERPLVSSGRTLFGIKSSVELMMDEVAAQMEAEQKKKRLAQKRKALDEARSCDGDRSDQAAADDPDESDRTAADGPL